MRRQLRFALAAVLTLAAAVGYLAGSAEGAAVDVEVTGALAGSLATAQAPFIDDHNTYQGAYDLFVGLDVEIVNDDPGGPSRHVVGTLTTSSPGLFTVRETLLSAEGQLSPTDLRNRVDSAVEIPEDNDPRLACIELDILAGDYSRVGANAVVQLSADITTWRVDAGFDCHSAVAPASAFTARVCGPAILTLVPSTNFENWSVSGSLHLRPCGQPTPPTSLPGTTTIPLPSPGPSYESDECDGAGSMNVVTGWVDSTFTKIRSTTSGTQTSVCVVAGASGVHAGGRLTIDSATSGLPHLDPANNADACLSRSNRPVVNGSVLGQDARVWVSPDPLAPDTNPEIWVCTKVTSDPSQWRRLIVPTTGPPNFDFAPDPLAPPPGGYPVDSPGDPGRPSAACQVSGAPVRLANVAVGPHHVAVHTAQIGAVQAVCLRVDGPGTAFGGRVDVDPAGHPGVAPVVTTRTLANRTAVIGACPDEVIDFTDPVVTHVRVDDLTGPTAVCFDVAGTRREVAIGDNGEPARVRWTPDP